MSTTITAKINGKTQVFEENTSLSTLIQQLNLSNNRLAIEVNEQIIPRSQHDSYLLQSDDEVEIVHAIGGG